jgi:hypothetical protein
MAIKRKASFDPKAFLAKVGEGRSIGEYHKDQTVFAQGDPADAVFWAFFAFRASRHGLADHPPDPE